MSKQTEALKLSLEALELVTWTNNPPVNKAITAIREALADAALDKKADNARELGLSYEQPAPSDMKQAIIEEASIQMTGHPSKDARCFAKSVYEYLMAEQPAPAPKPVPSIIQMLGYCPECGAKAHHFTKGTP